MTSLYISVKPVGSKFAKALQQSIRDKAVNKVYRVDHERAVVLLRKYPRNKLFRVTPQTLNKVQQFQRFKDNNVPCPEFETDSSRISSHGKQTWFARTLVNSTGGRGIVEFDWPSEQPIPNAPLYTKYIPKKAEYRVHVFNGQVIDVQQKKKKREFAAENRDTRIRNLANGYVYTRDGIVPPTGLNDVAISAVNCLGYHYGAVDIIYNEKRNQCYVLEVNSRPGLMGTTLERYSEALINFFNLERKA